MTLIDESHPHIKVPHWHKEMSPSLDPILKAARRLERMGCRTIAAECGHVAYCRKNVAGCVDVPVFMSILLQVPFIQNIIAPKRSSISIKYFLFNNKKYFTFCIEIKKFFPAGC